MESFMVRVPDGTKEPIKARAREFDMTREAFVRKIILAALEPNEEAMHFLKSIFGERGMPVKQSD